VNAKPFRASILNVPDLQKEQTLGRTTIPPSRVLREPCGAGQRRKPTVGKCADRNRRDWR
jgi:hypothetical protein